MAEQKSRDKYGSLTGESVLKQRSTMRQNSEEVMRRRAELMAEMAGPGPALSANGDAGGAARGGAQLKDLCPDDKAKISRLIKQVAELTNTTRNLETRLSVQEKEHRSVVKVLQDRNKEMAQMHAVLKAKLSQTHALAKQYQALAQARGAPNKDAATLTADAPTAADALPELPPEPATDTPADTPPTTDVAQTTEGAEPAAADVLAAEAEADRERRELADRLERAEQRLRELEERSVAATPAATPAVTPAVTPGPSAPEAGGSSTPPRTSVTAATRTSPSLPQLTLPAPEAGAGGPATFGASSVLLHRLNSGNDAERHAAGAADAPQSPYLAFPRGSGEVALPPRPSASPTKHGEVPRARPESPWRRAPGHNWGPLDPTEIASLGHLIDEVELLDSGGEEEDEHAVPRTPVHRVRDRRPAGDPGSPLEELGGAWPHRSARSGRRRIRKMDLPEGSIADEETSAPAVDSAAFAAQQLAAQVLAAQLVGGGDRRGTARQREAHGASGGHKGRRDPRGGLLLRG
ncbi:unnamed protein product [Pedinophyceae sp. YPF-701]|nr:unnamed protein product [Pedinophyceae sp. YPF-701]